MTLIAIKIPYTFTLRVRSTRKYNFEEVADFDDIVEDNYEWKSRLAGGIPESTQYPTTMYFRNSESLQEKCSSGKNSNSKRKSRY